MVAIPVDPEVHVPPAVVLAKVVEEPTQTVVAPEMAGGKGFTVTTLVAAILPHPLVTVYDIVDVPAATPVTTPPLPIVAIPVVTELHTPPPAALLNVVVEPRHTLAVPAMLPALGIEFTVTIAVALPPVVT
jgi:hypothetical protein